MWVVFYWNVVVWKYGLLTVHTEQPACHITQLTRSLLTRLHRSQIIANTVHTHCIKLYKLLTAKLQWTWLNGITKIGICIHQRRDIITLSLCFWNIGTCKIPSQPISLIFYRHQNWHWIIGLIPISPCHGHGNQKIKVDMWCHGQLASLYCPGWCFEAII